MTEVRQTNGLHPSVTQHFETMSEILHERDHLAEQLQNTKNELAVAKGMNIEYKDTIERLTKERDYYYCKAYAYTNTLTATRNHIQAMLDLADHDAEKSVMPTTSQLHVAECIKEGKEHE